MRNKIFIAAFSFALFTHAFQSYAMQDTLDTTEKRLLSVTQVVVESTEETNEGQKRKTKFKEGDIVKTVYVSPLEKKREGICSIKQSAYVVGIQANTETHTQIMEHLWDLDNVPIAQAYLCIKEEGDGYSSMQYVFTDPTYNINSDNLKTFLRLTLEEYLGYQGVLINNLHLIVPENHMDVVLSLFAPQIQQGLQVSAASAA